MKIFTVYCSGGGYDGYIGGVFKTYEEAKFFVTKGVSEFFIQKNHWKFECVGNYYTIKEWDL